LAHDSLPPNSIWICSVVYCRASPCDHHRQTSMSFDMHRSHCSFYNIDFYSIWKLSGMTSVVLGNSFPWNAPVVQYRYLFSKQHTRPTVELWHCSLTSYMTVFACYAPAVCMKQLYSRHTCGLNRFCYGCCHFCSRRRWYKHKRRNIKKCICKTSNIQFHMSLMPYFHKRVNEWRKTSYQKHFLEGMTWLLICMQEDTSNLYIKMHIQVWSIQAEAWLVFIPVGCPSKKWQV